MGPFILNRERCLYSRWQIIHDKNGIFNGDVGVVWGGVGGGAKINNVYIRRRSVALCESYVEQCTLERERLPRQVSPAVSHWVESSSGGETCECERLLVHLTCIEKRSAEIIGFRYVFGRQIQFAMKWLSSSSAAYNIAVAVHLRWRCEKSLRKLATVSG